MISWHEISRDDWMVEGRKMHELSVTKSIYQIVLKHAKRGNVKKVISVNLEIGALSDLQDEWV